MVAAFDGDVVEDDEHGYGAEDPEAWFSCDCVSVCIWARWKGIDGVLTPLVADLYYSAGETGDDHEFVQEDGPENGGPR